MRYCLLDEFLCDASLSDECCQATSGGEIWPLQLLQFMQDCYQTKQVKEERPVDCQIYYDNYYSNGSH